jgi:hypothetical protein
MDEVEFVLLLGRTQHGRKTVLVNADSYSGSPDEYFVRPKDYKSIVEVGKVTISGDAADELDDTYTGD